MSRQQQRDTAPELALRRALHRRGLRYRVHRQVIPGGRARADITFVTARVVVFVDGCFWHGCPRHATSPKHNGEWWAAKLARNVERDRETDATLAAAGWSVVRIWEHEDPEVAAATVAEIVRRRR